MARRRRVVVVLGTRPEAIKLAPVIRELRGRSDRFESLVVATGQHREMAAEALGIFGLASDVVLEGGDGSPSLGGLAGRLVAGLDEVYARLAPEWVLVQGDTTSAVCGAWAAFYRRVGVGHVEAGLRTGDRWSPFPEEVHRVFLSRLADLHFAPTERAAANLRAEGVPGEAVLVTGNTGVDALRWVSERVGEGPPPGLGEGLAGRLEGRRMVLVTSHRRESFGAGLESICRAVVETVRRHPDVVAVYPVHPNPEVRGPVLGWLGGEPRVELLGPLPYPALVWLMKRSHCILTDSGGIQEEAPSLGKPVLVLRDTTERPEAVEAGCARLVGTSAGAIVAAADELLGDPRAYAAMARARNPFGDGRASERIADALEGPD